MTILAGEPAGADPFAIEEPTALRAFWASLSAIVVKELRWRMRGRRAYVVVTIYVALIGLLVFSVSQLIADQASAQFSPDGTRFNSGAVSGFTSTAIGQSIFGVILILQTLLICLLAPALTSGAVSMEREKQTLELLITTPVSTLGMVVGKLISSLAYVILLILASIPLMSLVFAFGGIAPDDIVRAYILLLAAAFGLGSIGLFMSALLKRTQLATAISLIVVFLITFVAPLLHGYLYLSSVVFLGGGEGTRQVPPEPLVWLSPMAADIDLICTAIPDSYAVTCGYSATVVGQQLDRQSPPRDILWPRIVTFLVVLGVALTLATTQLIAKSRRIRTSRPRAPSTRAQSDELAA